MRPTARILIAGSLALAVACAPFARAAAPAPLADAAPLAAPAPMAVSAEGRWPLDLGSLMVDNGDLPQDLYRYEERDYGPLGAARGDEKMAGLLRGRGLLGGQERVFRGKGRLQYAAMWVYLTAYLSERGAREAFAENVTRVRDEEPEAAPLELAEKPARDAAAFVARGSLLDLFDSALVVYGREGRFSFGLRLTYRDGDVPQELVRSAFAALERQAHRLSLLEP